MPAATFVSKLNHASTVPPRAVASPVSRQAVGLVEAIVAASMSLIASAAFKRLDVPGEGQQVAPVAVFEEKARGGRYVAGFEGLGESAEPCGGLLRGGIFKHAFLVSSQIVSAGYRSAKLEHPSSDLASLGHLLPQGEKVGALPCRLSKSPVLAIGSEVDAVLYLLPLWEKVASRSEVG